MGNAEFGQQAPGNDPGLGGVIVEISAERKGLTGLARDSFVVRFAPDIKTQSGRRVHGFVPARAIY